MYIYINILVGKKHLKDKICDNDIIKEGYLYKKSYHSKKYKKRWMVLKGKYLYSYKQKNIYNNETEKFNLSNYNLVKISDSINEPPQFELVSTKISTLKNRIFIAESYNDMLKWSQLINKIHFTIMSMNDNEDNTDDDTDIDLHSTNDCITNTYNDENDKEKKTDQHIKQNNVSLFFIFFIFKRFNQFCIHSKNLVLIR